MPIQPISIQRRMMELGRIRLGDKTSKGAPRKLTTFRFTSASQVLLEAIAAKYGGTVKPWQGAPDNGYFELTTTSAAVDIVLPPVFSDQNGEPTYPFSQWFELWSGGGCQRRCDGVTEALSGKPCMCEAGDRACKPTTRVSFMMPDVPGLGVWRVESHGYNVAAEMPGTIHVLAEAAREGKFIPAVLRLEPRTSKKGGQTRKFVVPVIDLPNVTVNQIAASDVPLALNAPAPTPPRPELPAGDAPPATPQAFDLETDEVLDAEFGAQPELPPSERAQLVERILAAARTLGAEDAALQAIAQNRAKNETDEKRHLSWLKRQATLTEKALEDAQKQEALA